MKATQTLPADYRLAWAVYMKQERKLNMVLQLVSLGIFALVGWLWFQLVHFVRPSFDFNFEFAGSDVIAALWLIAKTLAVVFAVGFVTMTLHELVHGFFFWLFSRARPKFGLGPGYAYAGAPGWLFPKGQYLVVALAPLVVLTCCGVVALLLVPANWVLALTLGVLLNAGGASGDLYIAARISVESSDVLVKDTGDGFEVYRVLL